MSRPSAGQVSAGAIPATAQDDAPGEGAQAPERPGESALPATGDVVLDASYVIALLRRDPAASALAHVLPRGVMTSVTAGEVFAAIAETGGPDSERVEGVLRALGVRIVDLPLAAAHHFPALHRIDAAQRAEQRAVGKMERTFSLGNTCVLGYALAIGAPVLTADQDGTALAAHALDILVCHF